MKPLPETPRYTKLPAVLPPGFASLSPPSRLSNAPHRSASRPACAPCVARSVPADPRANAPPGSAASNRWRRPGSAPRPAGLELISRGFTQLTHRGPSWCSWNQLSAIIKVIQNQRMMIGWDLQLIYEHISALCSDLTMIKNHQPYWICYGVHRWFLLSNSPITWGHHILGRSLLRTRMSGV